MQAGRYGVRALIQMGVFGVAGLASLHASLAAQNQAPANAEATKQEPAKAEAEKPAPLVSIRPIETNPIM